MSKITVSKNHYAGDGNRVEVALRFQAVDGELEAYVATLSDANDLAASDGSTGPRFATRVGLSCWVGISV